MMTSVWSEVSPMMKVPSSDFIRNFVKTWISFSSIPTYLVILEAWMMKVSSSDLFFLSKLNNRSCGY